jgi:hypothetical protein
MEHLKYLYQNKRATAFYMLEISSDDNLEQVLA